MTPVKCLYQAVHVVYTLLCKVTGLTADYSEVCLDGVCVGTVPIESLTSSWFTTTCFARRQV